jgi:hypothetical protein
MDVIQLLITIVVVTILVTIVLAVVTYVAYKLRLAREPSALEGSEDGPRYFVLHPPPARSERDEGDAAVAGSGLKGHATQA